MEEVSRANGKMFLRGSFVDFNFIKIHVDGANAFAKSFFIVMKMNCEANG